jgi:hypothetical protein
MTVKEALAIFNAVLQSDCLNDTHELVFRCAWEGQTYEEIALAFNYDGDYLRHVGFQLWRSLSEAIGQKVTKKNFRSVLMQQHERIAELDILKQWLVSDRYRLIILLEMDGIGKTAVALKLVAFSPESGSIKVSIEDENP